MFNTEKNEKADELATVGVDKNKARGTEWKVGEMQDERGKRIKYRDEVQGSFFLEFSL